MTPGLRADARQMILKQVPGKYMANILTSLRRFVFSGFFAGFENADTVIRYAPIVDEILGSGLASPSILEIGSGTRGIALYLPFRVTGVDVRFDGDVHPNLGPVCQSGTDIPFGDGSFDYVVSVDMLEHVPPENRREVVHEMIRVARRKVFLAVPCGTPAEQQDRMLNDIYFKSRGTYYRYLQEHVLHGLPGVEEIRSMILDAAGSRKTVAVTAVRNFNLRLRCVLMRLWAKEMYYVPYLLSSLCLCLIKSRVSYGNCYRHIFKIDVTIKE